MPSWRSGEPVSVEAEVTSTFCGGGATEVDTHLLARVIRIDDEIVEWLERRARKKKDQWPPMKKRSSTILPFFTV